MQPLIGITMSYDYIKKSSNVGEKYCFAVEKAGGLPLAIPILKDRQTLKALAKTLSGLVLSGGPDVDPSHFNEKVCPLRDETEIYLTKEMTRLSKPVLGICRGMQIINVVMGGSLYQDIPSQIKDPIQHSQGAPRWHKSHEIEITKKDSILYGITGKDFICVNSFHHQSVKIPAPCCEITAASSDGVIEAMESVKNGKFLMGVQWHPEELMGDPVHLGIFNTLVDFSKKF